MLTALPLILILFCFAAIPTVFAIRSWRIWYFVWLEGITIPVEVRHHWKTQMGFLTLYYIIYEYEGEDGKGNPFFFNRHAEIELPQDRAMMEGEPLLVTYAANHPDLAMLEGQPSMRWRLTFGAILSWLYFLFMLAIMV